MTATLPRRIVAEFLGTGFLVAAVIGSIGRDRDVELRQASRQRQRRRIGVRNTEVVTQRL